jgi:perosamine synthetase
MNTKYPVYQLCLLGNEKKYVNECLDSNWISSKGGFVNKFEKAFCAYIGSKYAVTIVNGTAALHISLLALGIGPGDEVIVPSLTYIASVNAIAYTGASPVLVDSLKDTWQMDPSDVRRKITRKTKALMAVHLYGHPCEMDSLADIARENGLYIIEDCSEAFGSLYKNKPVGNFGDLAAFSFYGNKTITTGEGGMIITGRQELYDTCCRLKDQGLAAGKEYWHDIIGYNYRMTNIACAIGLAQLEQADVLIDKKRTIAGWYKKSLENLPLEFHGEARNVRHSYWMCSILTEKHDVREKLRDHLKYSGIETRPLFNPVDQMPIYRTKHKLPVAGDLSCRGLSLPSYPHLEKIDIEYIAGQIENYFVSAY